MRKVASANLLASFDRGLPIRREGGSPTRAISRIRIRKLHQFFRQIRHTAAMNSLLYHPRGKFTSHPSRHGNARIAYERI
jgi:hypothetical protein